MFSVYLSSDNDVLYLTSAYNFSTVKSITTNYILNNVATTNGKSAYIFVTLAILNRSVFRYFYEDAMKFLIKDFLRKCDQISRKLRICSHLLKKSSLENFIFSTGSSHLSDLRRMFKLLQDWWVEVKSCSHAFTNSRVKMIWVKKFSKIAIHLELVK